VLHGKQTHWCPHVRHTKRGTTGRGHIENSEEAHREAGKRKNINETMQEQKD
jgi:hypothetical protein